MSDEDKPNLDDLKRLYGDFIEALERADKETAIQFLAWNERQDRAVDLLIFNRGGQVPPETHEQN